MWCYFEKDYRGYKAGYHGDIPASIARGALSSGAAIPTKTAPEGAVEMPIENASGRPKAAPVELEETTAPAVADAPDAASGRCRGSTASGARCRRHAAEGSAYCATHQPEEG